MESVKKISGGLSDKINIPLMSIGMHIGLMQEMIGEGDMDAAEFASCLDLMQQAYEQILDPLRTVRHEYWNIREVSDGTGGTMSEIQEDEKKP